MRLRNTFYLTLVLFFSCDLEPFPDDSTGGGSVVSNFEVDNISNNSYAPSAVTFKNLSMNADSYEWNFGDPTSGNNSSTIENPEHVFLNPGIYTVTLIAKNNVTNNQDEFSKSVTINNVITFEKDYGENQDEFGYDVIQTQDGGYAILGYTSSIGNGASDFYLSFIDENGIELPNSRKTYGGIGEDRAFSFIQTQDGGYAIVGFTESFSTDAQDVYLILTDENGNEKSNSGKTYGELGNQIGNSIIQTQNGGYAIAGTAVNTSTGFLDTYLILTDADGNELPGSGKTFGEGNNNYNAKSIVQTDDGGFAIIGHISASSASDIFLILTDENGNELPSSGKVYGGPGFEYGEDILNTEFGFAIIGSTSVSGLDIYLILIDENGNELANSGKTFGEAGSEFGNSIIQTQDGGFAIVGNQVDASTGYNDVYLILTDANGNESLNSGLTFGFSNTSEISESIIQTQDGGFAIIGTRLESSGYYDFLLIKTDANGNL